MKIRATQAIMECLLEQGVDTIFGYPGGTILNVYDELYRYQDKIRHIFFVAETKGSMSSMDLSKIEDNKIKCARKLFEGTGIKVDFGTVDSYANLLDLVRGE